MSGTIQDQTGTRFDWLLQGHRQGPDPVFDTDLSEDRKFALLPTRGSLVPGWLLAIPRIKALSASELSLEDQSGIMVKAREAASHVSDLGNFTFILEHGPKRHGSLVGCGVDQAHLHIVPLDFDLISSCLEIDAKMNWREVDPNNPWNNILNNENYYLISDRQKAFIAYPQDELSQYFRKKIANALGKADQWDYKRYPCKENALRTINHIVGRKQNRAA